jgi:hypothetical protein
VKLIISLPGQGTSVDLICSIAWPTKSGPWQQCGFPVCPKIKSSFCNKKFLNKINQNWPGSNECPGNKTQKHRWTIANLWLLIHPREMTDGPHREHNLCLILEVHKVKYRNCAFSRLWESGCRSSSWCAGSALPLWPDGLYRPLAWLFLVPHTSFCLFTARGETLVSSISGICCANGSNPTISTVSPQGPSCGQQEEVSEMSSHSGTHQIWKKNQPFVNKTSWNY